MSSEQSPSAESLAAGGAGVLRLHVPALRVLLRRQIQTLKCSFIIDVAIAILNPFRLDLVVYRGDLLKLGKDMNSITENKP